MTLAKREEFPRVLMVLMTKIMAQDPSNLLIRAQFGAWPKDHLAQIHGLGDPAGYGEMCGQYYRLQACDRFLGGMFRKLRRGVFEMVAAEEVNGEISVTPPVLLRRWRNVAKKCVGDWLIGSGLWEVIFRVRLSEPMAHFIENFKPDLIYCQGYSLGFATLPLLIAKRFSIPICFQTTDDWPYRQYSWSPVGWLLKRRARELILYAKARLAFGEKMQREYQRRYGVPFEVTYHLDDSSRFPPGDEASTKECRIVYTGSLGHRRYEAIQDLLAAIRRMPELADNLEVVVYSTGIPKDIPASLLQSPEVRFSPLPMHEQLPAILEGATILLLPESFNETRKSIEYSISTKAHLYMMSRRPILAYGPAYSGTIDYAMREGWGLVVTERSVAKIKDALVEMLAGGEKMQELRQNADRCIQRNHDLKTGRERFLQIITGAALSNMATEISYQGWSEGGA